MNKILLVDDEDLELHGLISMINTFNLPLEICATARNGREGLTKAMSLSPRLVLTDLRMPLMNGLEMLRRIRSESPGIGGVLISGFKDFNAARESVEMGALAYLLKPVGRDDLYRVLHRFCSDTEKITSSAYSSSSAAPDVSPDVSLSDENWMRRLLLSSDKRAAELLAGPATANLSAVKMKFSVIVIKIAVSDRCDIFNYLDLLRRFAISQNSPAPAIIDNSCAALVLCAPAFINEDVFLDGIVRQTERLSSDFSNAGAGKVYIGVSEISGEQTGLPALYRQCLSALEHHAPNGAGRVVFYNGRDDGSSGYIAEQIEQIINDCYKEQLSIDAIAEKLFLSPSHIRRLFKNVTGATIMEYIESVRLDHSLRLLAQKRYKIHEIGSMVGYDNPSYFNAVF